MAEFINVEPQDVAVGDNVLFDTTVVRPSVCIKHREGSGLITLKGVGGGCSGFARFKVSFGANAQLPADATATAPIIIALAINGEELPESRMIVTPGAVSRYTNIFRTLFVDVPKGCCSQLSVKNVGTETTTIQQAVLDVERTA